MFRKSQVTIFMIIGIAILIAAGFFIYLSKSQTEGKQQDTNTKMQESTLKMTPIKDFVSGCLDKLAKDAIVLIGKQGGYIYKSQGGTFVDFTDTDEGIFYITDGRNKIAYNIKPLSFYIPHTYSSGIPDYPWITFPYDSSGSGKKTFTGLFGINGMPPLERKNGPHSIQEQIESYIDTNMDNCLDFTIFEGQGFEIAKSQSKTNVIFGASDISVESSIPVKIAASQSGEASELNDFSANIGINIRELYYFTSRLVQNDIGDITFSLKNSANSISPYIVRVEEGAKDDIVKIKDSSSLIYGQEFEYNFARKNMAPALYHIRQSIINFPPNYVLNSDDIIQDSELKAEDPDEDQISITIQAQLPNAELPTKLDRPQIKFKITASDGNLEDYQIITVNRI